MSDKLELMKMAERLAEVQFHNHNERETRSIKALFAEYLEYLLVEYENINLNEVSKSA